ncbi:phasin family protein [Marilutibacter aestuarii]|uniref:Phasin family protein n=1 Tax=Marilutibacter aestuarii TaxID=1706195 RepID=A0A508A5C8_9GAMM|nr:phasin family protein [Lysobacter aestuarii]TQD43971.1 phasin family protein [Lysobacter aestuarii]
MYTQFNEQFAAATRQFADTASQASRLMLENTEALFGLQMAAVEDRANATFAFFGEAAEARDFDAAKALWPKGVQIARENVERAVTTGQEAFGRTLKTNEAIAELAKGQFESAAKSAQANVEKATKAAAKAAK